jgi:hypothetical protein
MATRRVRVYDGQGEVPSTVLGFSAGAADAPDMPEFKKFTNERGYEVREVERLAGGVSTRYVEVHPPMSDDHVQELGVLCVGGELNGEHRFGIVDGYHDGVAVHDNRIEMPAGPLDGAHVIAQGN